MSDTATPEGTGAPSAAPSTEAVKLLRLAQLARSDAPSETRVKAIILLGQVLSVTDRGPLEALRDLAIQGEKPDLAFHARRALEEVRKRTAVLPVAASPSAPRPAPGDLLAKLAREADQKVLFPLIDGAVTSRRPEYLAILIGRMRKERDPHILSKLTKSVGLFGEDSTFEELCRYLEHPDSRVRANTLEGFSALKTEDRFKRALPLIRDPDNRVRANAVRLLRDYKEGDPIQLLREMLSSSNVAYRASALFVLSKFKSPAALELIRQGLGDRDAGVGLQAAEILVELGHEEGLAPIRGAMESRDEATRSLSLAALRRLQERVSGDMRVKVSSLVDRWLSSRYEIPAEESLAGLSDEDRLMAQIDGLLDDDEIEPISGDSTEEASRSGADEASGAEGAAAREAVGASPVTPSTPAPARPESTESEYLRGSVGRLEAKEAAEAAGLAEPVSREDPLEDLQSVDVSSPVADGHGVDVPVPAGEGLKTAPKRGVAETAPIAIPVMDSGDNVSGRRPVATPGVDSVSPGRVTLEEGHVGKKFKGTASEFDTLAGKELEQRLDTLASDGTGEARAALERAALSPVTEVRLAAKKRLQTVRRSDGIGKGRKVQVATAAAALIVALGLGVFFFLISRDRPLSGTPGVDGPGSQVIAAPPAPTTSPAAGSRIDPLSGNGARTPATPRPPVTPAGGAAQIPPVSAVPPVPPVAPAAPALPVSPAAPATPIAPVSATTPSPGSPPSLAAPAPGRATAPSSAVLASDLPFDGYEPLPGQAAFVIALTHAPAPTVGSPADAPLLESRNVGAIVPGRKPVKNLTGDGSSSSPLPSPDGKRIAFLRGPRGRGSLFVMQADGLNPKRVTRDMVCRRLSFSPGGNKILVEVLNLDEAGQIMASNVAVLDLLGRLPISARDLFVGRGGRFLTSNGLATQPDWHPRFAKIAFVETAASGQGRVKVVSPDGSDQQELPFQGQAIRLRWSPTGETVALLSEKAGKTTIQLHQGSAGKWTPLGDSALGVFGIEDFAWSPDGGRLALVASGASPALLLLPADGGPHEVLSNDGPFLHPRFSQDGKSVTVQRSSDPIRAALISFQLP